jgi:glutaredoxin
VSKKLTIEDFQVIAKEHGGKCLSDQYLNYNIKLRWECAKGHVWEASVDSIRQGHWCRKCGTEKSASKRRKSLEDMVLLAKRKNGKCLSEKYIDNATKLKWQCEKGHIWEATPGHIQNGRWCPYCKRIKLADRFKGDFQEYKDIAKSKGGSCLSVSYVNALTKLMWQCKEGHIWEAVPSAIKRGTWCPICGINRRADSLRASIEYAQRVAERHGGVCLSAQYIDAHKKLKWRCKEGHEWEASFGNVSSGNWCPFCAGSVKLTIEEMQKIARERGGLCLSSKYTNISTKLRWQCKEGHIWEAAPNSIKQGSWCPHCGGSMRLSLEQMQDLAKKKNGVCLSDKYINNRTKLKWQCENGHIWETTASSIIQGNWCPQCAGIVKKTIEDMHELAKQKNGRCLSEKYIDNKTKLIWQCERGHIWKAAPGHIQSGRWCPHCKPIMLADRFRGDFQEYKDIAKYKGGLCLSTSYVNARIKLRWQCKEGHIWEAVPSAIKRGTWCPKCSENISERICRKIFENIFNERFPKNRPDWLKLPNGRNMELDGYCSKLGIAFEYQGEQHYKDVLRYDGKRSLDQQKELDKFKRRKCEEHTVILIEVPFFVDYEKMPNFIIDECKKKNILVPKITKTLDYKLLNIYSPEKIKEMQEIAREKGGKCLSEKYINSVTKLKWQCEKGHTWEATPAAIKSGNWCHYCAGNLKWTLKQINDLAQEKKGYVYQRYIVEIMIS